MRKICLYFFKIWVTGHSDTDYSGPAADGEDAWLTGFTDST